MTCIREPAERLSLETLPPEIQLSILSALHDPASLHCLIQASPQCRRLFDQHAIGIFNHVLGKSDIFSTLTLDVIRSVVILRSSCLHLYAPRLSVLKQALRHHEDRPAELSLDFKIHNCTPSAAVLRSVCFSAHRIWLLTHAIIQHYLIRFQSTKPQAPVDDDFHFCGDSCGYSNDVAPWDRFPPGKDLEVEDAEPPSWIEEQRVSLILWQMQLFYSLQSEALLGKLDWPLQDKMALATSEWNDLFVDPFSKFCEVDIPDADDFATEQFRAVLDYITEETEPKFFHRTFPEPPNRVIVTWPTPRPGPVDAESGEGRGLLSAAPAWEAHLKFQGGTGSPLPSFSFEPWRLLGCTIWDTRRLARQKLLLPNGQMSARPYTSPGIGASTAPERIKGFDWWLYVWRSLLDREQIDQYVSLVRTSWRSRFHAA